MQTPSRHLDTTNPDHIPPQLAQVLGMCDGIARDLCHIISGRYL